MPAAGIVLKALRTRFWDRRPFILSHLVTARCNADCATCLWKMPAEARADELSTAEVIALYRDAAAAGFRALVLWGGEPMVRPDTGEVLRAASALGLDTTLITNGWWLDERGDEVLPWTRRLLLSVDAVGARHDEIRRCRGLFERLDRGLSRARERHPAVRPMILCVLSRLNLGELEAVAAYGHEHGAQVVFQAMNFTDYGFADRAIELGRVALEPAEEAEAAARIAALRARGLRVRNSSAYLARLGPRAGEYRCHYKKVVLRVEPNGDVLDCTAVAAPMVSVRTTPLASFVASEAFRRFVARAEACNRCRDAGVIELSHVWEGRLGALVNALRSL